MAKRNPRPCTPQNCGDLFPRCGTTTTIYTRYKCRCDACYELQRQATKRWRDKNPERLQEYRRHWYAENTDTQLESGRRWREENREHTRAYAREYRKKNPHAAREARQRWRAENKDRIAQYQKDYNRENREALQQYQLKYRRDNPEFHRAANQRRRALLLGAFIEDVDHSVVFNRDGYVCQRCGIDCPPDAAWPSKDYATVDHIIPLEWGVFRGGFHSYANTQTLCYSCNSAKGNRE